MKQDEQYNKNETLEQLPTSRPGNKVIRRQRKPGTKARTISQGVSRFFKNITSRYRGMK